MDARTALTNARIVDIAAGRYFPPGTQIIIRGDTIESVTTPGDSAPAPQPDLSLDLQGRAVIPGLFNTHCHLQLKYPSMLPGPGDVSLAGRHGARQIEKSLGDCLARGITHLRDALTTDLRPNRALKDRIARGEIPGPRLYQSVLVSQLGGTYTSPPGLFDRLMTAVAGTPSLSFDRPDSGIVTCPVQATEQQVRDAVNRAVDERGAECIKLYDQREYIPSYKAGASLLTGAQLCAAADQARKRGVTCTLHHTSIESFRRGAQAGVTSLAHLPCDAPLSEADVRSFAGAGCIIEPTMTLAYYLSWNMPGAAWSGHPHLATLNAYRERACAGLVDEFWLPEMAGSAKAMFDKIRRGQFRLMGLIDMSPTFRYYGGMISQGADNLRALVEAGARLACGNDAGAVPAAEAMAQLEIAMLSLVLNADAVRLSGADALRAATLHSAQALGVDRSFGSIEPGKIADLVVVDGDPLADPSVIGSRAAAVFMGGRLVIDDCGLRADARLPFRR